ncbi:MAG: hypothetical protein Q9193_000094 [Seirophora villosa]
MCRSFRNDSYIYNGPISPWPGGVFDQRSSTTWERITNGNALEAKVDSSGTLPNDLLGTDRLDINTTFSVENFPITIVQSQTPDPNLNVNLLGLDINSTFLNALYSAKAIASKTWSLALGWQGADSSHQTDGSLVLGGYDAAQTNGSNTTYPFSQGTPCTGQLVITVSDIVLNLRNGTSAGILPPSAGSAIRACVNPHAPWLSLPSEYFLNFLALTGYAGNPPRRSRGLNYYGAIFNADEIYDGDITIKLSSGFEVNIPNHQLVIPNYAIDTQGSITEPDSTVRELLISSLQNATQNHMPMFGRPFLSSAYLLVDQEQEEFTIWNYDPTSTDRKLVPIGADCSGGSDSAASSATTDSVPPQSGASSDSKTMSTGSIAGAVVGSLVGLALITFLIFRYYRRHQRLSHHGTSVEKDPRVSVFHGYKAELQAENHAPGELPLEQDPPFSLQPYEMAAGSGRGLLEEDRWSSAAGKDRGGEMVKGRAEMF